MVILTIDIVNHEHRILSKIANMSNQNENINRTLKPVRTQLVRNHFQSSTLSIMTTSFIYWHERYLSVDNDYNSKQHTYDAIIYILCAMLDHTVLLSVCKQNRTKCSTCDSYWTRHSCHILRHNIRCVNVRREEQQASFDSVSWKKYGTRLRKILSLSAYDRKGPFNKLSSILCDSPMLFDLRTYSTCIS
jgi:hypothetical protein